MSSKRRRESPQATEDRLSDEEEARLTDDTGWELWSPSMHSTGICICGGTPTWSKDGMLRCDTCVPLDTIARRAEALKEAR